MIQKIRNYLLTCDACGKLQDYTYVGASDEDHMPLPPGWQKGKTIDLFPNSHLVFFVRTQVCERCDPKDVDPEKVRAQANKGMR